MKLIKKFLLPAGPIYQGGDLSEVVVYPNVINIDKNNRTLKYWGNTYPISISRKGTAPKKKKGDNLTPEGEFTIIDKEIDKRMKNQDTHYGVMRPNAYGTDGIFFRLYGGSATGNGVGIHGTDKYNSPSNYGGYINGVPYGTSGCIGLSDADINALAKAIANHGGYKQTKVIIK